MIFLLFTTAYLCLFPGTDSNLNFLYTSPWYGSQADVLAAKALVIDVNDCVKNLQFTPVYIQNGLSLLSPIGLLNAEATRLKGLNIEYTIGESNELLNFIYSPNTTVSLQIQPMYPTDDELMSVVLQVFEALSNSSVSKQNILVIINRTQDFNNLDINNFENIIKRIINRKWINVVFLTFTSVENVIINLRQFNYFTIISILYDPDVNAKLINQVYSAHLMAWIYQWIIVDLLGGYNYLSAPDNGQGVLSNNVTIITFGQGGYSGRSILLQAAFNMTVLLICVSKTGIKNTLTGDFDGTNRINFLFNIIQNPGIRNKSLGYMKYDRLTKTVTSQAKLTSYFNFVYTYDLSLSYLLATGFRIGYIEYPPFSYILNGTYTGYTIDLLNRVLKDLNITPTYIPLPIKNTGSFDSSNYSFSGILGYVQNGTIDTVSIPIILTINRLTYFDFGTNVLSGNIIGAYKSSAQFGMAAINYYINPFDMPVWVTLLCSSLAIALGLAITDYLFPDKYARYKFLMSVFYSFSSLTHGAYFDPPRRVGGRILMCLWWLYCLFAVVIWVSNYAALLAKSYTNTQLTSFSDILNQNYYKYTTVNDDLLYSFLINNAYQNTQTIYRIMNEETQNGTVNSLDDALSLIPNNYIILYDDRTLYYQSSKNCLKMFGKFVYFDYGVIMPKYSEKILVMTTKLRQFRAQGITAALIDKYWPLQFQSCNSSDVSDIISNWLSSLIKYPLPTSFDINYMIGVFIIVVVGGIATMILAVAEKLIRLCVLKTQQQRDKYKYETTVEQLTSF